MISCERVCVFCVLSCFVSLATRKLTENVLHIPCREFLLPALAVLSALLY